MESGDEQETGGVPSGLDLEPEMAYQISGIRAYMWYAPGPLGQLTPNQNEIHFNRI